MTDRPAVPEPPAPAVPTGMRPSLRMRHVATAVVVGLLALGLALLADWWLLQPADHDAWADVVRSTVLALGLLGAVPAGYVAYRKQQTTEAEHQLDQRRHELDQGKEQRRQVELDDANVRAVAKDFRDRYTSAATQLGSDKAPIRLAGVYALAQLADEWGRTDPDQRQTCIDVLCSYLRMPWPLQAPDDVPEQDKLDKNRLRDEETRVREAILRVIATHLHKQRAPDSGWHQNDFDFTGAELHEVDMSLIRLEGALIANEAKFSGNANFGRATFAGAVRFSSATFSNDAEFIDAEFISARFAEHAWFDGATFAEHAWFHGATFSVDADFGSATFSGTGNFGSAKFSKDASFRKATFSGSASFHEATFSREVLFHGATFSGAADFEKAKFSGQASTNLWSTGQAGFAQATFSGSASFHEATFSREDLFSGATFVNPPDVDSATIFGSLVRTDGTEEAQSDEPRPFLPYAPLDVVEADPIGAGAVAQGPPDDAEYPGQNP